MSKWQNPQNKTKKIRKRGLKSASKKILGSGKKKPQSLVSTSLIFYKKREKDVILMRSFISTIIR